MLQIISRPFIKYNSLLERYPLPTKCVTSGVMYAGGDLIAQMCEHYNGWETNQKKMQASRVEGKTTDKSSSSEESFVTLANFKSLQINWKRTFVFFVFGNAIAGPSYHYWFNYLNTLPTLLWTLKQSTQRGKILRAYTYLMSQGIEVKLDISKIPAAAKIGKWQGKAFKIAADQLIFSSLYTAVFFLGIGGLNGCVDKYGSKSRQTEAEAKAEEIKEKYDLTDDSLRALKFRYKFHSQEDANWDFRVQSSESGRVQGGVAGPVKRFGDDEEDVDAEAALHKEIEEAIAELIDAENRILEVSWTSIWNRTWNHTKEVYWRTYLIDWLVWPPLQLINFTFVPVRFQFLYVNAANLAWNTFLSIMANNKH